MKNLTQELALFYQKKRPQVAFNSKNIQSGDLFFALPGKKTDGHFFLKEAALKNASAAVVSAHYSGSDFGLPLIRSPDPFLSLQELAAFVQSQRRSQIIAITGSVGKTTTKEFVKDVLKTKFRVNFTEGNCNSQLMLPVTLLNSFSDEDEIVVLEMGMDAKGHIANLVKIAPPDLSVITNVSYVHSENFSGLNAIAEAKSEILSHEKTKIAFLHESLKVFPEICLTGRSEKVFYTSESKYPLDHIPPHHKENFNAASGVASYFGFTEPEIREAAKTIKSPSLRYDKREKGGIVFINDSYNSSEAALTAGVKNLPHSKGKKIAVLGELQELGRFSEDIHRRIGSLSSEYVDEVIGVGPLTETLLASFQKVKHGPFPSYKEALLCLKTRVKTGDVVYVKGANSLKLWNLVDEF